MQVKPTADQETLTDRNPGIGFTSDAGIFNDQSVKYCAVK